MIGKVIVANGLGYKILKKLGQGGFGDCYKVLCVEDQKIYAMKQIDKR